MRAGIRVVLLVALTGILGIVYAQSAPAATKNGARCGLNAKLVPTCARQALFGAWTGGYPGNWEQRTRAADGRYGRRVDVVHSYHAPGNSPVPFEAADPIGAAERRFTAEGRVVLANFKPGLDFAGAATGAHDAVIRKAAQNIKSLAPHKVMLALFHEPENDLSGGAHCTSYKSTRPGNTPANYRAMWQRAHDIFVSAGVTNVVWVMNYMSLAKWDCAVKDVWPGNNLVDWVAYDPYPTNGTLGDVSRFPKLLAALTDTTHAFTGKPYMLAEFGSISCDQQATYTFYGRLKAAVDAGTVPNLRGLVVFDAQTAVTAGTDIRTRYDCHGGLDQREQTEFDRLATDPLLEPTVTN